MGRHKTPEDLRPVERTVRLTPDAFDVAYKVAIVQGLSVNALIQRTLHRIFTHQNIRQRYESCYGALQSPSTLTQMVSGSPPDGRCSSTRTDCASGSSPETDVSEPTLS